MSASQGGKTAGKKRRVKTSVFLVLSLSLAAAPAALGAARLPGPGMPPSMGVAALRPSGSAPVQPGLFTAPATMTASPWSLNGANK